MQYGIRLFPQREYGLTIGVRSTLRKSGLSELHRARHVGRWQSVVRQVCIQPRALVKREWAPVGGMDEIQGADEIVRKNLAVEETICVDAAVCSLLKWRVWQLRQWLERDQVVLLQSSPPLQYMVWMMHRTLVHGCHALVQQSACTSLRGALR